MTIQILGGSTSQTVRLFIQDTSKTDGSGLTGLVHNTSGLTAYYSKGATGTATAITLATQTAGGAWTSGGFVAVDGTNMPGVYRLDIPNAALDSEVETIVMLRGAANMAPVLLRVMGGKAQANAVTVADKTGYSLSTAGVNGVTDGVWNALLSSYTTNGSFGARLIRSTNANNEVSLTGGPTPHIAADVHAFQAGVITTAAFAAGAITSGVIATDAIGSDELAASAVTKIQLGLGTLDNQRYLLSILAGATSNAGTAGETYVITIGGSTYTVTYAGLDATGNRGTTAFAKT